MRHPEISKLALLAGRDLGWWDRLRIERHVRACERCRHEVEAFRTAAGSLRNLANPPAELAWNRLAIEMKANIRLGLAAGECVEAGPAPRVHMGWKPAFMIASLTLVIMSGWLLHFPRPLEQQASKPAQGTTVQATSAGIKLQQQKDRAFTVLYRAKDPVLLSVNTDGSVRARYVDSDTGQVTITNVYTE